MTVLYNVNPLSHSLMNFVYYFGSLEKNDEEKYIEAIIEGIFKEKEYKLKKELQRCFSLDIVMSEIMEMYLRFR